MEWKRVSRCFCEKKVRKSSTLSTTQLISNPTVQIVLGRPSQVLAMRLMPVWGSIKSAT